MFLLLILFVELPLLVTEPPAQPAPPVAVIAPGSIVTDPPLPPVVVRDPTYCSTLLLPVGVLPVIGPVMSWLSPDTNDGIAKTKTKNKVKTIFFIVRLLPFYLPLSHHLLCLSSENIVIIT
jgi:hypothetical protein